MLKLYKVAKSEWGIYLLASIDNDDKVRNVRVVLHEDYTVDRIDVYYHSNRSYSYSGNLSGHRMPYKYRTYILEAKKQFKQYIENGGEILCIE